jgi:hypothetical protein
MTTWLHTLPGYSVHITESYLTSERLTQVSISTSSGLCQEHDSSHDRVACEAPSLVTPTLFLPTLAVTASVSRKELCVVGSSNHQPALCAPTSVSYGADLTKTNRASLNPGHRSTQLQVFTTGIHAGKSAGFHYLGPHLSRLRSVKHLHFNSIHHGGYRQTLVSWKRDNASLVECHPLRAPYPWQDCSRRARRDERMGKIQHHFPRQSNSGHRTPSLHWRKDIHQIYFTLLLTAPPSQTAKTPSLASPTLHRASNPWTTPAYPT